MKLFRIWSEAPYPKAANADVRAHFSARAVQFCEPLTAAASLGVLIYPPIDYHLVFDGESTYIQFSDSENWILVDRIFLPDFADFWQDNFPDYLQEALPGFVDAFPERSFVQMWPGYYAETRSGVSLLIRSPINRSYPTAYRLIEGVIETDNWAGPMFTNIEWIKTDRPVRFSRDVPIAQLIPIARQSGSILQSNSFEVIEMKDGIPERYMQKMRDTYERRNTERPGSYKKEVRQRAGAARIKKS